MIETKEGTELVKFEDVPGTPFKAVKTEEGCYGLLGKYRLNDEPMLTIEDVIKTLEDPTWDIIFKVLAVMEITANETKAKALEVIHNEVKTQKDE